MKTVSETESFLRIQLLREQIETLKVERAIKLKEAGFKYDESLLCKRPPVYHSQMSMYSLVQQYLWEYDAPSGRWGPRFADSYMDADEEPPPISFSEPSPEVQPEHKYGCSYTNCMNNRSW